MSLSAAIIRELVNAGLKGEALIAACERIEARQQARAEGDDVSAGALRQRRYRERNKASQSVTVASPSSQSDVRDGDDGTAKKESPHTPKEKTTTLQPTEATLPSVVTPSATNRGTRLPRNWQPSADDWRFAVAELGSERAASRELEKFQDYWDARAGPAGVKRDWSATWRNWIRRQVDNGKQGHNQGRNGRQRGGIVDLAAGYLGVSPEWPDDRNGRSDDLRGSSADADAEGWPRSPTHAITGRA